jgi:hypothetical protein
MSVLSYCTFNFFAFVAKIVVPELSIMSAPPQAQVDPHLLSCFCSFGRTASS